MVVGLALEGVGWGDGDADGDSDARALAVGEATDDGEALALGPPPHPAINVQTAIHPSTRELVIRECNGPTPGWLRDPGCARP